MYIPDSSPLDSRFQQQKFAGFRILLHGAKWSDEQLHEGEEGSTKKVMGESFKKILGSASEIFERADEIKLNQDHVLEKPTQLAVVDPIFVFAQIPFLLSMTVIL